MICLEEEEQTEKDSTEDLMENDEVSPEEEAFMRGYDEAEEESGEETEEEEPEEE